MLTPGAPIEAAASSPGTGHGNGWPRNPIGGSQLDNPLYNDAPLVTSIASQLLAAVVLSTFPHSGLAEPNP